MTQATIEYEDFGGANMNGKADKFKKLAERRVTNVIKGLRAIAKLSRRTSYDYSSDQVSKIFDVLDQELREAEKAFAPKVAPPKEQSLFTL